MLADPVLADGGLNAGAETVATVLVVDAVVVLVWFRSLRRRVRGGATRPPWLNALPILSAVMVGGALLTPTFVKSEPSKERPETRARVAIVSPQPGASVGRDVQIRAELIDGKLAPMDAPIPSTLPSDRGHIHFYVDDVVRMVPGLVDRVELSPGQHTVRAEYVAVDHAPFRNPPVAAVAFTVA